MSGARLEAPDRNTRPQLKKYFGKTPCVRHNYKFFAKEWRQLTAGHNPILRTLLVGAPHNKTDSSHFHRALHSKNKTPGLGNAIPVFGVKLKRDYVFWQFFNINLCSATLMESSRRDLLNDMAERKSILKNNQNTYYFVIFQDRSMFSHINGKLSPRPFE